MGFLIATVATLLAFLVIDAIWIGTVALKLYQREVGDMLRENPRLIPAAVFYVGYAAGIVLLAVRPGVAQESIALTMAYGAVLGALAYGTFAITNYTLLSNWTMTLVVSDIAWGAVVTALAAACGYYAMRLVG